MGYTTKFSGHFELSRPLTMAEAKEWLTISLSGDAVSDIAGAPVNGYLQWVPTGDLQGVVWDGNEKFYDYVEWLQWVIEKWVKPWGVTMFGTVRWSGEEVGDTGAIEVNNNIVTVFQEHSEPQRPKNPLTLARLREMALEKVTQP